MSKRKIPKAIIILFMLSWITFIPIAQAQTAEDLLQQANSLRQNKEYDQAEALYKQIIAENPKSDIALEADKLLAFTYIACNNADAVVLTCQSIIADFIDNPNITQTLYEIAGRYNNSGKREKANELYDLTAKLNPDDMYAQVPINIQ
jgi:tetratricopeptide (TPR) repeat protein